MDGWDGARRREPQSLSSFSNPFDPADVVHRYILRKTDDRVQCSIVSDTEASMVLRLAMQSAKALRGPITADRIERGMLKVLEERARVEIQDDGYATLHVSLSVSAAETFLYPTHSVASLPTVVALPS